MSQYPDGNITEQHHRGWDSRRRLKRPNREFKGAENIIPSGKIIKTFRTFMQQFGYRSKKYTLHMHCFEDS